MRTTGLGAALGLSALREPWDANSSNPAMLADCMKNCHERDGFRRRSTIQRSITVSLRVTVRFDQGRLRECAPERRGRRPTERASRGSPRRRLIVTKGITAETWHATPDDVRCQANS